MVSDVSFRCEPGTVTGFLGPNGAGKTTTMRMLVGLSTPDAGTCAVLDRDYHAIPNPGRHVGVLLDASAQHPGRSGREALIISARMMGVPDGRVDELLTLVGLDQSAAKKRVRQYSLGMRQRLGLANALLGDPQVLILDEPANGLDPEGIRWMRGLLQGLAQQGRTVLVSSHLLSEMEILADDVVIIAAGKLVTQGPVDKIVGQTGTAATVRVRTPNIQELVAAVREAGGTVNPNGSGAHLVTGLDAAAVGRLALKANVELHELVAERPDLEHVFLELTQGRAAIR